MDLIEDLAFKLVRDVFKRAEHIELGSRCIGSPMLIPIQWEVPLTYLLRQLNDTGRAGCVSWSIGGLSFQFVLVQRTSGCTLHVANVLVEPYWTIWRGARWGFDSRASFNAVMQAFVANTPGQVSECPWVHIPAEAITLAKLQYCTYQERW